MDAPILMAMALLILMMPVSRKKALRNLADVLILMVMASWIKKTDVLANVEKLH